MTLGSSALTRSSNLQVRKLQKQLESLLPDWTASRIDKGTAAPMPLLASCGT